MKSINQSINSVKTFARLSSAVVMGMALFASGQAFAVGYYSISNVTNFTDGTKWSATCGGAALGGTITPAAADFVGICVGTSLTPAATDVFTGGTLAFDPAGGAWGGGVLKFSAGNKILWNGNASLAPIALNISSMTTGNTITISNQSVTFSSVTSGSLSCGGAAYTAGTAIAAGTTCTVTVVAAPPAVSAPLDFDFNKSAKIFTYEIKVK